MLDKIIVMMYYVTVSSSFTEQGMGGGMDG